MEKVYQLTLLSGEKIILSDIYSYRNFEEMQILTRTSDEKLGLFFQIDDSEILIKTSTIAKVELVDICKKNKLVR